MFGYMVQLYMKETYERRHPVCMNVYEFCVCVSVILNSISIKITVNWPDRNNQTSYINNTWTFFKLKQKYLQLFKPLLNQTHHFNLSYHCLGRKLCRMMAHIVSTWLLEVSTNNASAASLSISCMVPCFSSNLWDTIWYLSCCFVLSAVFENISLLNCYPNNWIFRWFSFPFNTVECRGNKVSMSEYKDF